MENGTIFSQSGNGSRICISIIYKPNLDLIEIVIYQNDTYLKLKPLVEI